MYLNLMKLRIQKSGQTRYYPKYDLILFIQTTLQRLSQTLAQSN